MRILIPILGFGRHGGQRVLSQLANGWVDLGHDVAFLTPETSAAPYFPTKAEILSTDRNGVVAKRSKLGDSGRKVTGVDNLRSLCAGLNKIGSLYDVILANNSLTTWPVKIADCGAARKYYYIQAYEPEYHKFRKDPIKHLMSRWSYRLRLVHITNSEKYPIFPDPDKVRFVPPGVDTDTFHPRKDRAPLSQKDEIYLGTIGRTEPYKGTRFALEAFERLHQADPRFKLRIAFGNLPEGWAHPAAEVIDIKNDIELAEFYRSVDVLLVACIGQSGAPHYPLIEGMSCGTPVVHTGYYPGTPANSWIVAPGDTGQLVIGVNNVVAGGDLEERTQNAIEFVSKNLNWQSISERMLSHFQEKTPATPMHSLPKPPEL